ncbi:MAG: MATE family efflux transporter [Pontibacterium sp.]
MSTKANLVQDPIKPTLVRMTVPMMFGIVSLMLFNLVDLFFIGQLGTEPLAAVGFTFPVTFSITSLGIGLGVGTSATLGRLMGAGERNKASCLATDNLWGTLLLVVIVTLLARLALDTLFAGMGATPELMPYIQAYMGMWLYGGMFLVLNMVGNSCMRAAGDTKTPAKLMALSSLINLILDPLLIFGWGPVPALGVEGAALASVIAWAITLGLICITLYKRQLISAQSWDIKRVWGNWYEVMRIGVPAATSNMMTPIANGFLTAIVAGFGSEAVAAFGVGNRLESLSLLVCLALSMSLPPFISQNDGAGQNRRVSVAYRMAVQFALIWQAVIYLVLWLFADAIATLFSDQQEVQAWIKIWILIVPIGFGFQATTFLTASSFNALHQPLRAMRISVTRLFLLYVPLGWIGSHFWGLEGMFVCLVVANALTAATAWWWMSGFINRNQRAPFA